MSRRDHFPSRAVPAERERVRDILEHPTDRPWRIQNVGLLGLWLDDRRIDVVRLAAQATTLSPGDRYRQSAGELHSSHQIPGTVTLIRFGPFQDRELTVCVEPGAPWVSGAARQATPAEVQRITGAALDRFPPS